MYNELRDIIKDQSWYTKGYLAEALRCIWPLCIFLVVRGKRKGIEFGFFEPGLWNKQALQREP